MILSYQYRIYPNATQTAELDRIFDVTCHVYNDMLSTARLWYEDDVKWNTTTKRALRDTFTADRNEYPVIKSVLPAASIDALSYRIDGSMRSFFALLKNGHEDARPPRAVARRKFGSIPYWYNGGVKLIPEADGVARLRLWGVDGLIRVHQHRPIPDGWTIQQVIVMQKRKANWYITCQIRDKEFEPGVSRGDAVGIDLGMYSLLALSNGELSGNPRWYRNDLAERQRLGRQADRRRRASNPGNYNDDGTVKENAVIWRKSNRLRDTEQRMRRLDEKAARRRKHYWHEATDELTKKYRLIAIEDLTLDFMIKNKHLAMSVHDASFATFWQMLDYKCAMRGVELVRVPPQYTSQVCSGCGEIVKKPLSERVHRCVACGLELDRDVNAARNILELAINGRFRGHHDVTQANRSNVS